MAALHNAQAPAHTSTALCQQLCQLCQQRFIAAAGGLDPTLYIQQAVHTDLQAPTLRMKSRSEPLRTKEAAMRSISLGTPQFTCSTPPGQHFSMGTLDGNGAKIPPCSVATHGHMAGSQHPPGRQRPSQSGWAGPQLRPAG